MPINVVAMAAWYWLLVMSAVTHRRCGGGDPPVSVNNEDTADTLRLMASHPLPPNAARLTIGVHHVVSLGRFRKPYPPVCGQKTYHLARAERFPAQQKLGPVVLHKP